MVLEYQACFTKMELEEAQIATIQTPLNTVMVAKTPTSHASRADDSEISKSKRQHGI